MKIISYTKCSKLQISDSTIRTNKCWITYLQAQCSGISPCLFAIDVSQDTFSTRYLTHSTSPHLHEDIVKMHILSSIIPVSPSVFKYRTSWRLATIIHLPFNCRCHILVKCTIMHQMQLLMWESRLDSLDKLAQPTLMLLAIMTLAKASCSVAIVKFKIISRQTLIVISGESPYGTPQLVMLQSTFCKITAY